MLDWVPEGHAVRVVISTVERLATRDLAARLVPPAPRGRRPGPARYDPVMLLTVWMYAYLRGVLSTRAVEDRCRYDATFRVACGREVPGPYDVLPVPQAPVRAGPTWPRTCFTRCCTCARARGWAGCGGGRRRGEDRRERVEGGQPDRGRAAEARRAGHGGRPEGRRATRTRTGRCCRARTCCWARTRAPGPDPRSRAGRVAGLPGRPGRAGRRAGGRPGRRPRAGAGLPGRRWKPAPRTAGPGRGRRGRAQLRLERPSRSGRPRSGPGRPREAAGSRVAARPPPGGPRTPPRSARPAPGWRTCRPRPPRKRRPPGTGPGRRAAAAQRHRPGLPAAAGPRRRVHPGLQLPGRRRR